MSDLAFHWFLPTTSDSRGLAPSPGDHRRPSIGYLADVARAAEHNGFESVLTPTGSSCEDAWLVASALSQVTQTLKFIVAFRAGFTLPTLAAQQAATFQRLSGNRLLINIVSGGDAAEQRSYGDQLGHDDRYERTDEFLQVVRGCWAGRGFDHRGRFYEVDGGGLVEPIDVVPTIFFGGASDAAHRVSARHADVQLMWGEPPPLARERVLRIRDAAAAEGRTIDLGIRLHVIARRTAEQAWADAQHMLETLDPQGVSRVRWQQSESEGARRLAESQRAAIEQGGSLEIYPNLWAGTGLVRNATAVVGSYEQVAERLAEYHDLGIDHFILSGYPNLEESYTVGEGVLPLLRSTPARRDPNRDGDDAARQPVLTAVP